MLEDKLRPQKITDIVDNIDLYLEEMRNKKDKIAIPKELASYVWGFFRDVNPEKEKLKILAVFVADHTYRYAASVKLTDDYTQIYFVGVIAQLWDSMQSRGVDIFYILDNELRENRFMLTIQLFALSGVAVVTPYMTKGSYHKYMTPEEQAKWALSFSKDDFNPKKITITIDSSEDLRYVEVMNLIEEYMKHQRNIVYIEKDASVNYLDGVKQLAKESKYMSVFRNKAPNDDPNVTIINN